jgi:hypothetical protein
VLLLVAADHYAANLPGKAEAFLADARGVCAAQGCGSLDQANAYSEAVKVLEEAKLTTALAQFRAGVRGSALDPGVALASAALARLPALRNQRVDCSIQVAIADGEGVRTAAGDLRMSD